MHQTLIEGRTESLGESRSNDPFVWLAGSKGFPHALEIPPFPKLRRFKTTGLRRVLRIQLVLTRFGGIVLVTSVVTPVYLYTSDGVRLVKSRGLGAFGNARAAGWVRVSSRSYVIVSQSCSLPCVPVRRSARSAVE